MALPDFSQSTSKLLNVELDVGVEKEDHKEFDLLKRSRKKKGKKKGKKEDKKFEKEDIEEDGVKEIDLLKCWRKKEKESTEEDKDMEEFDLLKCSKIEKGKKEEDVKLPTGYRFDPDDYEIVVYYLFNKLMDRVLPIIDVMKEIDVYQYDPDQLPNSDFGHGNTINEAYYFTYLEQIYSSQGKKTIRTTKGGYWNVVGKEKKITFDDGDVIVGFENFMVFYKGQAPKGIKTPFVMHEYRLNPHIVPVHVLNDSIRTKIDKYVVCRIINKEISNYEPTFILPPELTARRVDKPAMA